MIQVCAGETKCPFLACEKNPCMRAKILFCIHRILKLRLVIENFLFPAQLPSLNHLPCQRQNNTVSRACVCNSINASLMVFFCPFCVMRAPLFHGLTSRSVPPAFAEDFHAFDLPLRARRADEERAHVAPVESSNNDPHGNGRGYCLP